MPSGDVPVRPIGGPGARTSLIAIGIVVAALAIALIKPWGGGTGPRTGPSGGLESPNPPPTPTPQAPVAESACPGEWRLFTVESAGGQTLRTWYSLDPALAGGPLDRSIPTIRVYTSGLQLLGYCAGSSAAAPPVILNTTAWQIVGDRAFHSINLRRAIEPDLDNPSAGALFLPPAVGAITPHTWPLGRYVFVVLLDGDHGEFWFAAEVVAVPSPGASAGPTPGRSAPPSPRPSPAPIRSQLRP